jgi:hypothetical protein
MFPEGESRPQEGWVQVMTRIAGLIIALIAGWTVSGRRRAAAAIPRATRRRTPSSRVVSWAARAKRAIIRRVTVGSIIASPAAMLRSCRLARS